VSWLLLGNRSKTTFSLRNFHNLIEFFFIFNAGKMSSHDEEEDEGPSVDSLVAEERIAARRLRIQRRLEAARRFVKTA